MCEPFDRRAAGPMEPGERGELTISPRDGLQRGNEFHAVIRYDGEPAPIEDAFGDRGFMPTDDGVLVAGEPHVAATWYPVNDHPLDKATYTFRIKVPKASKPSRMASSST